ncbi:hypothetical protein SD427_18480 [Chryseobacterium sp. JJR-5R]|uniref:hypothetical protein n=1 Tax=Chryseobacterium sp. JJR-5R TaxID=3093923 RepID=UPI002A74B213|nr:hypothetical protein [Chryseobacterium sp. JJR-5R]WPO82722.1 hypothetical protein SD427_18480 [Chryseobacterium sp. JJR-5R]
MGTAGIKKALIKEPKQNVKQYGTGFIVELGHSQNTFTAYIDRTCLGTGTQNPDNTISSVKWFLVREHIWKAYKALYPTLGPNDFFETLKTQTQDHKTFEGNNKEISIGDIKTSNGNVGVIYLLIPFSVYPELDGVTALRVVALDRPQVLYCHFKFPSGGYLPLQNTEKKAAYGQTVQVEIYTHLLPDFNNRLDKFVFNVELLNKGKVVAFQKDVEITNPGQFVYNGRKSVRFFLDPEWQKNHNGEKQDEKFYLRLSGIIGFTAPVLISADAQRTTGEYDSELATSDWSRLEHGKWVYDTSRELLVPYDTMSSMMGQFEVQKNNQIQYIGDIRYTKREYDPCGYSKITVKDDDDAERDPLILFDEEDTKNPIDRTSQVFSILGGDTRKNISITLDKLSVKDVFCQGILLEEGQKHSVQTNVFQVDKVFSAQRNTAGFITQEDKTHSQQQKDAGITVTNENRNDTDVLRTNQSYSPSAVQHWQSGVDYKFSGDSKIILMLRYMYNKTVLERYTSGLSADVINNLWLFNYFVLKENMAQTYFLPVSTCRYPNQVAKIKVYPNVSWTFHLNYGMKNPLYYRDTWVEMRQHRVEDAVNKAQAADIEGYNGDVQTKFSLSVEAKWNGSETAKLDQKISENVKLIVGKFIKIKKFVDNVTGKDRGNSTDGMNASLMARVRRTPLTIEILSPQLAFGAGWEYKFGRKEKGEDNILVPSLGLVAKADPAIGAEATIDLIAWGKKLHPAAEAVITALDLLAYAANAEVRFDLKFFGKLIIQGSVEFSRLKKEGELKGVGEFGFSLTLSAKATGKVKAIIYEVDYDFEAKAEGKGYFSLGISAGWDDNKGLYLQPIVRHSGIKITLTYKAKFGSTERETTEEFVIIKEGKAEDIDTKFYLND